MLTNLLISSSLIVFCFMLSNNVFGQYTTNISITDINNQRLTKTMEQNASALLTEINLAFFEDRPPRLNRVTLTDQAINTILLLWETSKFRCYETELFERAIQRHNENEYEVRNIPLFFHEAYENENYEEAVLVFNPQGKIDNFYISIGTNRVNEILREANDVTDYRRRQIILDFVEKYRTAYNTKDIDFLEKILSQDALFISAVIDTQRQNTDITGGNINNYTIDYTRGTQSEYMAQMRKIFMSNAFIDMAFKEVEVMQHGRYSDIYGVTLKKRFQSSIYSNSGYMFFMIGFADEDDKNPIIHVITWQPEEYIIRGGEVFDLGSFGSIINR